MPSAIILSTFCLSPHLKFHVNSPQNLFRFRSPTRISRSSNKQQKIGKIKKQQQRGEFNLNIFFNVLHPFSVCELARLTKQKVYYLLLADLSRNDHHHVPHHYARTKMHMSGIRPIEERELLDTWINRSRSLIRITQTPWNATTKFSHN